MPFLLLNENDVRQLLTMDAAIDAVDGVLRAASLEEAQNIPRARSQTDHVMLHVMSGSAKGWNAVGYKAYATSRSGAQFHVGLFDGKTGALTALIQADWLGQMRTGAASGVATRALARSDASTVGLFGAGKQARTQLLAVCAVRPIRAIRVYSRRPDVCRAFCEEMTPLCKCSVEPAQRPEDAARNLDVVITATNSREPVLFGDWLSEGTHLNIIGSNFLSKTEIDVRTVERAGLITVDDKDQAHIEAGDFREAIDKKKLQWANVHELGDILVGRSSGRTSPSEITMFKSLGLAIEDVATAAHLVTAAKEKGVGRWIDW